MHRFRRETGQLFRGGKTGKAFTLVELLVVVTILGALASMALPGLRLAKGKAQGLVCVSNLKQLTLGWLMYADDAQGWLCPNAPGPTQGWVGGKLDFAGSTDNTNTSLLLNPQYAKLAPYVNSTAVYRCPSDRSVARFNSRDFPRVRSFSMNDAVGSNAQAPRLSASENLRIYRKLDDVTSPAPSSLWVLIEQHPDSISDGGFAVDCGRVNLSAQWIDFPSNFHNQGCALSFADGHSERHAWRDGKTMPPNRYCGCLAHYAAQGFYTPCPGSPDIAWLQARTSERKNQ